MQHDRKREVQITEIPTEDKIQDKTEVVEKERNPRNGNEFDHDESKIANQGKKLKIQVADHTLIRDNQESRSAIERLKSEEEYTEKRGI